jgi:hypothetical protein
MTAKTDRQTEIETLAKIVMGLWPTLHREHQLSFRAPTLGYVDDVWHHESEPKVTRGLPDPALLPSSTSSKVVNRTLLRAPAQITGEVAPWSG